MQVYTYKVHFGINRVWNSIGAGGGRGRGRQAFSFSFFHRALLLSLLVAVEFSSSSSSSSIFASSLPLSLSGAAAPFLTHVACRSLLLHQRREHCLVLRGTRHPVRRRRPAAKLPPCHPLPLGQPRQRQQVPVQRQQPLLLLVVRVDVRHRLAQPRQLAFQVHLLLRVVLHRARQRRLLLLQRPAHGLVVLAQQRPLPPQPQPLADDVPLAPALADPFLQQVRLRRHAAHLLAQRQAPRLQPLHVPLLLRHRVPDRRVDLLKQTRVARVRRQHRTLALPPVLHGPQQETLRGRHGLERMARRRRRPEAPSTCTTTTTAVAAFLTLKIGHVDDVSAAGTATAVAALQRPAHPQRLRSALQRRLPLAQLCLQRRRRVQHAVERRHRPRKVVPLRR
eukprot:Rhum_TRINITY_DN11513_c0_g1::Rhum_TRINITY_DN11513_c0_g1_i1::g.45106::m.45106